MAKTPGWLSSAARPTSPKSLLVRGFSKLQRILFCLQTEMTSHVKRANSMPTRSFCRALSRWRMLCLALLKTVQGVPKWQYTIHPDLSQFKMTSWVCLRLRSWCVPLRISTAFKTPKPSCTSLADNRPVPEKSSKIMPRRSDRNSEHSLPLSCPTLCV